MLTLSYEEVGSLFNIIDYLNSRKVPSSKKNDDIYLAKMLENSSRYYLIIDKINKHLGNAKTIVNNLDFLESGNKDRSQVYEFNKNLIRILEDIKGE